MSHDMIDRRGRRYPTELGAQAAGRLSGKLGFADALPRGELVEAPVGSRLF